MAQGWTGLWEEAGGGDMEGGKGGHGGGEIPGTQWQERSGSTSTLTGWTRSK